MDEFQQSLESLDDNIDFQNAFLEEITPTCLSISTITFGAKIRIVGEDCISINIASIVLVFDTKKDLIKQALGNDAIFEIKVSKKHFLNCVIFHYNPTSAKKNNKAIKLFSNGSLHITGAKSGVDTKHIMEVIVRVVSLLLDKQVDVVDSSFNVQMINSNFSVQKAIDLLALQALLKSKYNVVAFTKDKYPGLKFKSGTDEGKSKVTTIVFVTGNIIITGSKNSLAINDAYQFITTTLEQNLSQVELVGYQNAKKRKAGEPPKKRGRKKKCVTAEFYSSISLI